MQEKHSAKKKAHSLLKPIQPSSQPVINNASFQYKMLELRIIVIFFQDHIQIISTYYQLIVERIY